MTSASPSDRLSRLRDQLEAALRTSLEDMAFAALVPAAGAAAEPASAPPPVSRPGGGAIASTVETRVLPRGTAVRGAARPRVRSLDDTVFAGNERTLRELAKEIRRLVAEDRRRGLRL